MESNKKRHDDNWKSRKRARRRKIILVSLLAIYALMGWLRLQGALAFRDYFISINLHPGPTYLAVTGGLLGFTFSLAITLIIFNVRFAGRFARWLAVLFLVWFWVDRIWLSTQEAFFNQLEISFLVTLVTLFWAFVLIRKKDLKKETITRTDGDLKPPQSVYLHPVPMHESTKEEDGEQTGTGS